jgi:hypothetical protein
MRAKILAILISALCMVEIDFAQWIKVQSPEIRIPISTEAIAARGDTLWVGTYRSTLYRSTNNGLSWMKSDSGISYIYWTWDFLLTGDTMFAIGEEGVFRSINMGESWTEVNPIL